MKTGHKVAMVILFLFLCTAFAGGLRPSYLYRVAFAVDTTTEVWTCPDTVSVQWIYAAKFSNIKLQARNTDTMTIPVDSCKYLPMDVYKIYKHGTDSLSRVNQIFLYGIKR